MKKLDNIQEKITVKNNTVVKATTGEKKAKSWADFKKPKKTIQSKEDLVQNEFDKNEWTW